MKITRRQRKIRGEIEDWLAGKIDLPVDYVLANYFPFWDAALLGEFHTPPVMAQWVADNIFLAAGAKVLDPCAGIGSLLWPFMEMDRNYQLEAIELSSEAAQVLQRLFPALDARHADAFDHMERIEGTADFVLMNPPFGALSGADTAREVCQSGAQASQLLFLELAVRALRYQGTGMIIGPANLLDSIPKKARSWFEDNMAMEHQYKNLPGEFALTKVKVDAFHIRRISMPPEPAPVFSAEAPTTLLSGEQLALF